jgi:predicted transcriptional regulator
VDCKQNGNFKHQSAQTLTILKQDCAVLQGAGFVSKLLSHEPRGSSGRFDESRE